MDLALRLRDPSGRGGEFTQRRINFDWFPKYLFIRGKKLKLKQSFRHRRSPSWYKGIQVQRKAVLRIRLEGNRLCNFLMDSTI